MMSYPEYVEVKNKRYKINTDFRIAIKCDSVAKNTDISDYERALAVIYLLFGEVALKDINNHNELLILAKKFLSCGKEENSNTDNEEPDMDFNQDMDYIEASFMSDYGIDLTATKMHWWKFSNLISGLSNSEFGNCCVLNRIRNLRNLDTKEIKDTKEKQRIEKAKKMVALKKGQKKREYTDQEKQNINEFYQNISM